MITPGQIALVAGLALGGLVLWQRAELADARAQTAALTRDLAEANAIAAQAAETAAVHRAHLARMQREAEDRAALIRDLQTMEGSTDAPLSDYLGNVAKRLWP